MSKIKKALERSRASRAQNLGISDIAVSDIGLSEREKLERDIRRLLQEEHPELLGGMKKQIKLQYSKTRKIPTDPQVLLSNRIFALTHEFEITQQIEILRTQVLKRLKQMKANSLMITSANNGEGKTFISTNLAVSIAQNLDSTVMLVDADLRNRSYKHHNMANLFFNSNRGAGLSDYLSGTVKIEDLLINPGIPRLTILPSGKALPDSAALLGSQKMEQLINDMKSRYASDRVLLFDCSSFMSNADPLILSRFVDAVLVIVEDSKTEINSLLHMMELLKDKKIIGTVINKAGNLSCPEGADKTCLMNASNSNLKLNLAWFQDVLRDIGMQYFHSGSLLPRLFRRRTIKSSSRPHPGV
jgi:protein-tyrosine kinase